MSLVIAKKEGNKVYVGADTIKINPIDGIKCKSLNPVKILKLENGVIVGFTGFIKDSFHITDNSIWDGFSNEGLTYRFLVEKVVKRFKQKLTELNLLKEDGTFDSELVVVWHDRIFSVDRKFNVMKINDLFTSGVGSDLAYLSCSKSNKCAKEAVLDALRVVNENYIEVSAPYDIIDSENMEFEKVEA